METSFNSPPKKIRKSAKRTFKTLPDAYRAGILTFVVENGFSGWQTTIQYRRIRLQGA